LGKGWWTFREAKGGAIAGGVKGRLGEALSGVTIADLGVALFLVPLEAEEGEVDELDDPGDDIGGDGEFVIENCALVHGVPFLFPGG